MKKLFLLSVALLSLQSAFAKDFTCTIKNIHQPKNTDNVIEFDVYVKNTSNKVLQLQAFQAGINFNYDQLANGGVITGEFVKGSGDKSIQGKQLTPNWNVNASSHQIRLLAAIETSNQLATTIPNSGDGLKIGTFRLTNTVPFATATPNFVWTFNVGFNKTKALLTAFVGNNKLGTALTSQTTFSTDKQGPEYFVENNPVINAKSSGNTVIALTDEINIYPNPVTETIKIDLKSAKEDVITVKVIDQSGRIVKEIQENVAVGNNSISMDLHTLNPSATYMVQVLQNGKMLTTKQIIKQ